METSFDVVVLFLFAIGYIFFFPIEIQKEHLLDQNLKAVFESYSFAIWSFYWILAATSKLI